MAFIHLISYGIKSYLNKEFIYLKILAILIIILAKLSKESTHTQPTA